MGSLVAELAEKLSSATNNFDIDEGTIYVNTSADTVAIGGTSPDGKFSIHQSASADILNLYDGTTAVFTVLDGGNVGIGTTAPSTLLHIERSSTTAYSGTATTNDSTALIINTGADGHATLQFQTLSSGTAQTGQATISSFNESSGSKNTAITFGTRQNSDGSIIERMRIKSDGNVGIGTTSITSGGKLEVYSSDSTTYAGNQSDVNGIIIRNDDTTNNNYATLSFFGQDGNSSELFGSVGVIMSDHGAASGDGSLFFQTMNNNTNQESMRIQYDGKVGIGTTAPDGILHIHNGSAGSITAESASNNLVVENSEDSGISILSPQGYYQRLYFGSDADADAGQIIYGGANVGFAGNRNHMLFYTNGSEKMRIASDGKVGIGTNGPSTTFHVQTEDAVTNAVTTVATLRHTSTGTVANGFGTGLKFEGEQPNGGINIPMAAINTVWNNGSAEHADLRVQTGDGGVLSDVMTLTYAGRVGIGTSDPSCLFNVKGSGADHVLFDTSGTGGVRIYHKYYGILTTSSSHGLATFANATSGIIQVSTNHNSGIHLYVYAASYSTQVKTVSSLGSATGYGPSGASFSMSGTGVFTLAQPSYDMYVRATYFINEGSISSI